MQLAPLTAPDARYYHVPAALPQLPAAAPLAPGAFPDVLARNGDGGSIEVRTDDTDADGYIESHALYRARNTDPSNGPVQMTWSAGADFLAAVRAAEELVRRAVGEQPGAIAVLQASDGTYYLTRPSQVDDEGFDGISLDPHAGTRVRPVSRHVKALVDVGMWVDLRS